MIRHCMKDRGLVKGRVGRTRENPKDLGKPRVRRKYALRSLRISAPTTATKNRNSRLLEVEQTSLNVSDEDLFENVVELPPIPNSESQSELPQGIRVFNSTPRVSTSTPRAKKKRKVDSSQEAFYQSMQQCLGDVGKKTVNETFAAFIASELDNLP
ncbi:hypothetical protein TNCV_4134641 [Trichonephila clavipes]|nr:hypothetical protein TNCV_4134641 [Trichonephila clavipes]